MNHCEDSSLLSGQADAEDYLRTRENEDRKLVLSAIMIQPVLIVLGTDKHERRRVVCPARMQIALIVLDRGEPLASTADIELHHLIRWRRECMRLRHH